MPRPRRIAQNILSNWFALLVTTVIGFFLSPFVVHHLGNSAYGVWVLIASLVSYMGLLDMGMRSAVTRYVSRDATQKKHDEASEAVSGALWIRLLISLAIAGAGLLCATGFNHIFTVPLDLQRPARITVLITAITVAVNLWCGVFAAVLVAFHRYDLTSVVSTLQACARALGFVLLLWHGYGIVALAICDLSVSVAANLAYILLSFRVYPQLTLAFGRPSRATLRKLWTYSSYAFLINVAIQVTYYTDNVVVGAFLTPTAVTLYAIGGVLITYARQIVSSMTTTFTPLASTFEAQGNEDNLRRLLIHGTRAALIVSLPIEVGLFFRGHTFIRIWMGAQYAQPSGTVMQILLLSMVFSAANVTSAGIVFGMGKHKPIALWAILEAVANLGLSIFLVRRIGIYGVAWGSAIPSVIIELALWPSYICRLVKIPVWSYLWHTWFKTGAAVFPFAVACAMAERYWPARNMAVFFLQILVLLPLFLLGLAFFFREELTAQARIYLKRRAASGSLFHEYESSTTSLS